MSHSHLAFRLLGCSACLASGASAQRAAPLPIDAALAQPSFRTHAPITLSPDGTWVAYTLMRRDRTRAPVQGYTKAAVPYTAVGAHAWITEVSTGLTLSVGEASATTWAPTWSPDGRWLAFYSDADGAARLWVRETATGRIRRVSDVVIRAATAIQGPRWTPDSRKVLLPIRANGSGESAGVTPRQVPPDSAAPAVTVLRTDPAQRHGGNQVTTGAGTDSRSYLLADLALVDVLSGETTVLARRYWPAEYSVAPNGEFAAFTSSRPPELSAGSSRATFPFDLLVVPLAATRHDGPKTIAAGIAVADFSRSVVWSPDGTELAYSVTDSSGRARYFAARSSDWQPRQVGTSGAAVIGADPRSSSGRSLWWDANGRSLYVLDSRGVAAVSMPDGVVRSVTRAPEGYETLALAGRPGQGPAWSDRAGSLRVVFSHDSTKRMGFARVNPASGTWQVVRSNDRFYGTRTVLPLDVTDDGRMVFLSEDARHPADIWSATRDLATVRQVTHSSPQLEGFRYGETRLIEWTTATGASRRGTLLLPSDYRAGARYPLVVYPYPLDRRSDDLNVFGVTGTGVENMQLLATRGFAVLAPDVPPFDWTDEMRELARVIMPGVDRAIALGIADSARLGVMGHSWGGYTVLALLVQTQRFRAAVMRGGHGDALASYGNLQPSGLAFGLLGQEMQLGGTVWEQRERYIANSPIYQFDRVRTPLLIVHGEKERTVPIFLADQVFASLQRLGQEVEYARYTGENHSESLWAYANQRDYVARVIRWFSSHLQRESSEATGRASETH